MQSLNKISRDKCVLGWSVPLISWALRGCHLPSCLNLIPVLVSLPGCVIQPWGLGALDNQPLCACPWMNQSFNYSWVGILCVASSCCEGYPLTPLQRLVVPGEYQIWAGGGKCPFRVDRVQVLIYPGKGFVQTQKAILIKTQKFKTSHPFFSPVPRSQLLALASPWGLSTLNL